MQSFVVWSDEIEGRLDPLFYHPEYIGLIRKLKESKYEVIPVGAICKRIVDGPFGTQLKVEDYTTEGIPVIRVSNVKTGEITEENLVRITVEKHLQLKRSRVLPNDVVLTKAGAILGYSAVFPSQLIEGNITSHLVTITCKPEVNPYYLKTFFLSDAGQKQIYRWGNKSTRPELNTEEVRKIFIPVPSLEIQAQIVESMQSAYKQKKQKEAEAQRLLDSIDGYVLDELGIRLPEVEDKMYFAVSSDEVQSNRVDAYYYQPKFEEIEKALRKGKYDLVHFATLMTDLKNGVEIRKYADEGYRYLRVTDLGKFGIIDNTPRLVAVEEIPERIKLHDNSFLISRSGSLGLVSVAEEKIKDVILSSHIFKVDLDISKILPAYLEAFFRSTLGQIQFFRKNNGGIVPEISQSALKSLMVVIPSLEIQNKISEEVKRRISEAEKLKAEASKIIGEAKKQVEEMILGD